jgi:hypothetical protein
VAGSEGTAAASFVSGLRNGIGASAGGFYRAAGAQSGERGATAFGTTESTAGALFQVLSGCSASGQICAEEPPSEPVCAEFTIRSMSDVSVAAQGADIVTVLNLQYDYDWSSGTYRKAMALEAPEQVERYGRIRRTMEAKWLQSPRQAYLLGERTLRYLSRSPWTIQFTDGIEAAAIPPGVWVNVSHPHVPVSGRMLVMNSELSPSAAEVRLTVEAIAGDAPEIVLAKLSEAYAPQLPDGISVTYVAGHAIFTITDEEGKPIPGAKVTLDGGLTLPADSFGKVSFQTVRGVHHLKIQATGYVTQELDVTV